MTTARTAEIVRAPATGAPAPACFRPRGLPRPAAAAHPTTARLRPAHEVAVLLLLALVLRGWGTWFDQPHFDEWAAVNESRVLMQTGALRVHVYGPVVTMWAVVPEFVAQQCGFGPAGRYMLHRLWVGVLPGILTIAMVWYVAWRLTRSRRTALAAGLLLTFAFVHFEASHYAKADMLALALLLTPVVAAVRARDETSGVLAVPPPRHAPGVGLALVAGGFIGAAVACRMNMVLFVVMWPVYFLLAVRRPRAGAVLRLCVVYCLAAGVVWSMLHLVCLRAVDWSVPTLIAHVVREAIATKYTYASLCHRPWWYYFAPFAHDLPALGVGVPIMLAAAAGVVWGRPQPRHRALWWALIATAGLYLVFLCGERIRLIRWASPLTPFVALSVALLLKRLHQWIAGGGRRPVLAGLAVVALMLVLVVKPIQQMVLFDLSAGQRPTTLSAAKDWLERHPDARYGVFGCFGWGLVETQYPYHYPATTFGCGLGRVMEVMDWIGGSVGVEAERPEPAAKPDPAAIVGPVELMQRDGLDYIVVGGWRHDLLSMTPDAYTHDAEIKRRLMAFAAEARARLRLCARFAPTYQADWGMTYMGRQQTLEIYALPPAAAD